MAEGSSSRDGRVQSMGSGWDVDVSPQVRRARARAIVSLSEGTNRVLPRSIYEDAGVDVPPEATDELQIMPKKRHWWQRWSA